MRTLVLILCLVSARLFAGPSPSPTVTPDTTHYFAAPAGTPAFFAVFTRTTVFYEPFRYSSDGQTVYAHITGADVESLQYLVKNFRQTGSAEWASVAQWNVPRKPFF